MSFTARQQHCLEAMGLVPWVSSSQPVAPEVLAAPVASPLVRSSGAAPADPQALSLWLPHQPFAPFLSSGRTRHFIGPEDAALLVIVETGPDKVQQPLEGDAARLFDLMMRAISITRQKLRIGALDSEPSSLEQPCLTDLYNPQTKAVLVLLQNWDASDDLAPATHDSVQLVSPPCLMWRIPHPDVLLQRNQLKRQAWQSLQALQRVL